MTRVGWWYSEHGLYNMITITIIIVIIRFAIIVITIVMITMIIKTKTIIIVIIFISTHPQNCSSFWWDTWWQTIKIGCTQVWDETNSMLTHQIMNETKSSSVAWNYEWTGERESLNLVGGFKQFLFSIWDNPSHWRTHIFKMVIAPPTRNVILSPI